MKTQIRFLLTLGCAATASLLIIGSPAQAGYIVTLEQVGSNVVATGSGAIDLTGLSLIANPDHEFPNMQPSVAEIETGLGDQEALVYSGTLNGPTNFGSGGFTFGVGSGDLVGIRGALAELLVPLNYMSNKPLSDTATYTNQSFISLGAIPGTYEWTWGTGANQNFTIQIGPAGVPDTGSSFALLLVALSALFGASRFCSLRLA